MTRTFSTRRVIASEVIKMASKHTSSAVIRMASKHTFSALTSEFSGKATRHG